MAIEPLTTTIEMPKFTHVDSYTVYRLGAYPSLEVRFQETVYRLTLETTAVTWQWDTVKRVTVSDPAWIALGQALLGRYVATPESDPIGQVTAVQLDDPGPSVTLTVAYQGTLSSAPTALALVEPTPTSPMSYRPAVGSLPWAVALNSVNPAHAAKMQELLVQVHVTAAAEVLAALGASYTLPQIQAAVIGLAMVGRNVDTYLAEAGETLELARRNGQGVGQYIGTGDPRV